MRQKIIVFSIVFLFILSIFLQTHMYQEWDMLFALEGGKRLLAGGTYVKDMFDNNPPLIFYLGIFINILANVFSVSSVFLFKLVSYLCILYSLGTCHYLLNCGSVKHRVNNYLLLTLAFCLLILPVYCLGEREHLMLTLTMPYFLLLYQRASGMKFGTLLKITISFLAALGFALKPYFLFGFIFSELLFVYWQGKWRSIFRLETQIILSVIILYLISIAVFMPSYYHDILPLVLDFYAFNNNNIVFVLTNAALINALLLILIALFLPNFIGRMEQLFIAIALGFTLSFILQGKGWYYHALPLMTINSLLATSLIYQLVYARHENQTYTIFLAVIIGAQFLFTLTPAFLAYRKMLTCYKNEACGYPPLIKIAREYAENKPIFFFSTLMGYTIPIVYYSDTTLASRFPTMWLLSGIINRQHALARCDKRCQNAKNTVRNYVIEDFKRYQPELVFVDISPQKAYINIPFNYLKFMQKSPAFKTLWQQYCYLLTNNNYAIYRRCSSTTN